MRLGKVATMTKKDVRLYLAHVSPAPTASADEQDLQVNKAVLESENPQTEDVACYIADLLESLGKIASEARLDILSDLIHVAGEEAKLYCQPAFVQKRL